MDLDKKDLLILFFLQQDSRMSLSELGKKLDMSPSAISYRLEKLIENNVIHKFSILLNHEILTPNYQSYLVELSINDLSDHSRLLSILYNSTFFDRILELARPNSITGVTLPLSTTNLKELTSILNDFTAIKSFSITPVLADHHSIPSDIVGENVSRIYCPLCQKSIKGEGIVTEIDNKYLSFCCRDCKEQYTTNYEKIKNSNNPN